MATTKTKARSRNDRQKTARAASRAGRNGRSNGRAARKGRSVGVSRTKPKVTVQEILDHLTGVRLDTVDLSEHVRADEYEGLVREIYQEFVAYIRDALLRGRPVALPNVGTLVPYFKKKRVYRHPEDGKLYEAARTRYIRLVISTGLKADLQR